MTDIAVVSVAIDDVDRLATIILAEFGGARFSPVEIRGNGVFFIEEEPTEDGFGLEVDIDTRYPDRDAGALLRRLEAEGIVARQAEI